MVGRRIGMWGMLIYKTSLACRSNDSIEEVGLPLGTADRLYLNHGRLDKQTRVVQLSCTSLLQSD
jgi:hypothetical protein